MMSKKMIAMVVIMLGLTVVLFFGSTEKVVHNGIEDKDKYHQFADTSRNGQLLVFPETIPDETIVTGYYYSSVVPPVLTAKYQIYLSLEFSSDEAYNTEINRLKTISHGTDTGASNSTTTHDISVDTQNFLSNAYVAMSGYKDTYEYAVINDTDKTIVYVYLQSIDEKNIKFDEKYMPRNYGNVEESFSIYN